MKKFAWLLLPVCLALSGLITGCKQAAGPKIDIIQIHGASWASNVTTSYGWFGATTEIEEQNKLTLAASDGDLLYMTLPDDQQFYYRYSAKDGKNLELTFDTLGAVSVYLNGELNYLELTKASSLEAFSALTDPEITQLSTLNLNGPRADDIIPILKEHESRLQGIGLVLENGTDFPDLNELLGLCRPEFLVLHNTSVLPEPDANNIREGLELLWIDESIPTLSKTIACCGDLESLIITAWETLPGEILPLSSLNELHNLTLAESNLTSLQNIEFPEALRSLNLIYCDTLGNIDQLEKLTNLRRLSLTACEKVNNIGLLQSLESLRWISFPGNISHQEFQELCGSLSQLEVVELLDCPEITDLLPLNQVQDLRILSLQLEKEQLGGLDSLTQLEVLTLNEELFTDNPEWIKELRASLPQVQIVPGSGMCLGSGWLLLLLPLILLFRFTFRQKA